MTCRFENVSVTEHGTWARVCEKHSLDPTIQSLGAIESEYTCAAESLCDIDGCTEAALCYIDFYDGNLPIKPTEFGRFRDSVGLEKIAGTILQRVQLLRKRGYKKCL